MPPPLRRPPFPIKATPGDRIGQGNSAGGEMS